MIAIDAAGDKVILKADARKILLLTLAIQSAPRFWEVNALQKANETHFSRNLTWRNIKNNYDVLKPPMLVSLLCPTSKTTKLNCKGFADAKMCQSKNPLLAF